MSHPIIKIGDLIIDKHFLFVSGESVEVQIFVKILKVNWAGTEYIKDVDVEYIYQLNEYFDNKPYYSDKFKLPVNHLPKSVSTYLDTWIRENSR